MNVIHTASKFDSELKKAYFKIVDNFNIEDVGENIRGYAISLIDDNLIESVQINDVVKLKLKYKEHFDINIKEMAASIYIRRHFKTGATL